MYRKVEFDNEEYATQKLNLLVRNRSSIFQTIVTDDDDETYIPDVDFEYTEVNCMENQNLTKGEEWNKFYESNKPIIFTHTTELFEQYKGADFLGCIMEDGVQAFTQLFYFFHRDRLWEHEKAKFIFLVTEENLVKMYRAVNWGMAINLEPICLRKRENAKNDTKKFMKRYKID